MAFSKEEIETLLEKDEQILSFDIFDIGCVNDYFIRDAQTIILSNYTDENQKHSIAYKLLEDTGEIQDYNFFPLTDEMQSVIKNIIPKKISFGTKGRVLNEEQITVGELINQITNGST